MESRFKSCPNKDCKSHKNGVFEYYLNGHYKTKHDGRLRRQYKCKTCRRTFTQQTFKLTKWQKKPEINKTIYKLYCMGVTIRDGAKFCGIDKNTFMYRMYWLSKLARDFHEKYLSENPNLTSYVQFDEMETYEHTKMKPLTIPLAVRAKNGFIIDAQVGSIKAKGPNAPLARKLYGYRADDRHIAIEMMMNNVKKVLKDDPDKPPVLACDKSTIYPVIVPQMVPNAKLTRVRSIKKKPGIRQYDEFFKLNHTCAKIRASLSRLTRRTWVTTKNADFLRAHLDLFIASNNGYELSFDCVFSLTD